MASPLESRIAAIVAKAAGGIFLSATLVRDVAGTITDPADPPAPTRTTTYTCKAIENQYGVYTRASGQVNSNEVELLILAGTLSTTPQSGDRITIRSATYTIVSGDKGMKPVKSDPARATWSCRCST